MNFSMLVFLNLKKKRKRKKKKHGAILYSTDIFPDTPLTDRRNCDYDRKGARDSNRKGTEREKERDTRKAR